MKVKLNVRVEDSVLRTLQLISNFSGDRVSSIVNRALQEYIEKNERTNKR